IYGEVSIPLVRDLPFMESFDLIASGRYSEITSENADGRSIKVDGSNYRVTANWRVSPLLRVRGSVGTSFRAPGLFEQFLANESRARRQSDIDVCIGWQNALNDGDISQTTANNCQTDGIPGDYQGAPIAANEFRGGGFGLLEPEESKNATAGFILTPSFETADVDFSLDYFEITIEDQISTLSGSDIVTGCYASQNFSSEPLCDLFTRGDVIGGSFRITDVTATFINIDTQTNRGVDATLNVGMDSNWGRVGINLQATHQLEDNIKLLSGSGTRFLNGAVGEPEWVGLLNFTLEPTQELTLRWGTDYVGETSVLRSVFDENDNLPEGGGAYTIQQLGETVNTKTETEAVFYHSISAQYAMDNGWTLRAGVNNLFDEQPPALTNINDSPDLVFYGNTPLVSQYDILGRRLFLNVSKSF
ncbi:MAG: TonB-dependent receptor, partial [Pseudomonadota bacterium]